MTREEQVISPLLDRGSKLLCFLLSKREAADVYDAVPVEDQGYRVSVHPVNLKQSLVLWAATVEEYQSIQNILPVIQQRWFHGSLEMLSSDTGPTIDREPMQGANHEEVTGCKDHQADHDNASQEGAAHLSAKGFHSALDPLTEQQASPAISDSDDSRFAPNKPALTVGRDTPHPVSHSEAHGESTSVQEVLPPADNAASTEHSGGIDSLAIATPRQVDNSASTTHLFEKEQEHRSVLNSTRPVVFEIALALAGAVVGGFLVWIALAYEAFGQCNLSSTFPSMPWLIQFPCADAAILIKLLLAPAKLFLMWSISLALVGYLVMVAQAVCKGLARGTVGAFNLVLRVVRSCLGRLRGEYFILHVGQALTCTSNRLNSSLACEGEAF